MSVSIDWKVESLRITAFPVDISKVSAEEIWDTCIGTTPDEIRIQRGGIESRETELNNGRVFLIKQIDRIDWRYHAKQENGEELLTLPIIGSLESELNVMGEFTRTFFDSRAMFSTSRLAFGAVLLFPVGSVIDGYNVLRKLLPSLNLDNVKDLNYQVNRPRESNVIKGVSINRLSRWNVTRLRIVAAAPTVNVSLNSIVDELFACRLELDINTAAEQNESISSDSLLNVLDELISIGLELSERGDVL